MLNDDLRAISDKFADLLAEVEAIKLRLEKAAKNWPDYQVRVGAEWYGRDKTPPDGWIWASNGLSVWLIQGRGEPIGDDATAVKFWTDAYVPAPRGFIKRTETHGGYQPVESAATPIPPGDE